MKHLAVASLLLLSACGDCGGKGTSPAASASAADPTAGGAPKFEIPKDAMGAKDLIDKFKADEASWSGKEVTVAGVFNGANYTGRGDDKKLNNIQIAETGEDGKHAVTCETSDEAPIQNVEKGTRLAVRGKVRKFFDSPALTECKVVQ